MFFYLKKVDYTMLTGLILEFTALTVLMQDVA